MKFMRIGSVNVVFFLHEIFHVRECMKVVLRHGGFRVLKSVASLGDRGCSAPL